MSRTVTVIGAALVAAACASCSSISERLTGTRPQAKCVAPRNVDDTIVVRLDTVRGPLTIKLGGCK